MIDHQQQNQHWGQQPKNGMTNQVVNSIVSNGAVSFVSETRPERDDNDEYRCQHAAGDSTERRQDANILYDHHHYAADAHNHHNTTASPPSSQRWNEWVRTFQSARAKSGEIVNHPKVQFGIVILIAINAIMMGVATFSFVRDDPAVNRAFETADLVFLIIFTVELAMQLFYRGCWRVFTDGWLCFDFVIITLSWAFAEIQIIRAFRIFRALRLITRVKVMQNLVKALFSVIPRMFAIGLLLLLISYVFAVLFTQLFKTTEVDFDVPTCLFCRLDATFFTLFQIMTLDAWADICRAVMEIYPWAWFPFIAYIILSAFVVMNLIIAVICDAIAALHDDDKAKIHGQSPSSSSSTSLDNNDSSNDDLCDYTADSQHGNVVGEPLDSLEHQVDELTRLQAQALQTMQTLAQQLDQTTTSGQVAALAADGDQSAPSLSSTPQAAPPGSQSSQLSHC